MALVYLKGFVGNLGTIILIENKYEELSKYFSAEFLRKILNDINGGVNPPLFIGDSNIEDKATNRIIDRENIARGGLLTALWKICDRNKCGLRYTLSKVPILQGTIEISNYFDLNPYRLLTDNSEILLVDDSIEDDDINNNAAYGSLIGHTTKDKKRVRIDNDIESFLTKDYKDEIDRIIPGFIKNYEKHSNSQK